MNILKIISGHRIQHQSRHKIPRYLYHLTNRSAYDSMLKDGVIKISQDDMFKSKGVFAIDLVNFFKRWRKNKNWGLFSLQEQLIKQAAKGEDKIVMLKIPTDKLKTKDLVLRSQNICFDTLMNRSGKTLEYSAKLMNEGNSYIDAVRIALEKYAPRHLQHIQYGTPAKYSKLFKQRKEAIEYIYPHNINMSYVQKVGEVNLKQLRRTPEYDLLRPMRSIFIALLKETSEVKGAQLLNC